ncbi:MAG: PAS domain-containing protein [Lentisphaerae bacterium]|nr:PAS domain-containing protein [Lentisphaerota bacterium]
MKSRFVNKLIDRIDKVDSGSLQRHFMRLTKEKGLLESIFNAIHEGIIVAGRDGIISYANNAAQKLLGFSMQDDSRPVISRVIRDVDWDRAFDPGITDASRLISKEIEVNYPEHRFINFYIMPLALSGKESKEAVLIFRDMTSERERELNLMASERFNAVTLLAAGVAHEIGNPLNSINIHLQLMKRELADLDPETKDTFCELLGVAENEVERLNLIITEFLQAIRPREPNLQKSSIEEILKETLLFLKQEIEDRDIVVELHPEENAPTISVDRDQIKQVFFNLIKNAIQAMSQGGILKISIKSDDRWLGITFSDSGCGIALEDIAGVFEPYYTSKDKGSGLGLMIVKRIIQAHGGELNIHSEPGTGTIVGVLLPLDERRIRLLEAPAPKTQAPVKDIE